MKPAPPAELLLGRTEFAGDLEQAAAWTRGQRVLVTGAAGSVGTPLSALLAHAEPGRLVLLDHHEYSLFTLERSLGSASAMFELADIRDAAHMRLLLEQHRPDVVFHLAAAKHVPYGERFPEGTVATNVVATAELLRSASDANVKRFVYPSSDKSVDPPALYGATKRICEALVAQARGLTVRYVNIVGTRGSVIEVFSNQILADRPLSVTDERMTRYWISMAEAVWSLLITARDGQPGDVLMPDCGEPVALLETARRLAGWYRPEVDPYPIACMGSRPGERLHEVLLSRNESFAAGPARGLRQVVSTRARVDPEQLNSWLAELQRIDGALQRAELKRRCMEIAEALQ